jgi:hypothetical protein
MPHDQSLRRAFLADGILNLRAASRASLSGAMNFTSISSGNGFGQTRHMSPEETVERLRRAQVGRLATVRPDRSLSEAGRVSGARCDEAFRLVRLDGLEPDAVDLRHAAEVHGRPDQARNPVRRHPD